MIYLTFLLFFLDLLAGVGRELEGDEELRYCEFLLNLAKNGYYVDHFPCRIEEGMLCREICVPLKVNAVQVGGRVYVYP